ncbi:MAG TPA: DUF1552 domain-containing protein [Bryobacteraceae bacterium]|jgi:hypothetical protein
MILTRKALDRRRFLRGLGTALALPMLDAMVPAGAFGAPARAGAAAAAPTRLAFVYVPNGIIMKNWIPATDGADFEFTRLLKPLEAYRENLTVLTGLAHKNGLPLGDGPGDHARAAATFLTGVHPKKTEGSDIHLAVSADQAAAQAVGHLTKFPSIELGLEGGGLVGNCDSGYSCAYSNSISWRSPTSPLPPEVNPRAVFERLFGDGEFYDRATRLKMAREDRSILDFVQDDAKALGGSLGKNDQTKLDEYLYSVREIERRIQTAEKQAADGDDAFNKLPAINKPQGIPVTFEEHAKLMFDLQVVAFQTDSTRIISCMMGREGSNRTYRSIGVPEAHHGLSHHMGNTEKIEKLTKINELHTELFAYFLNKMKSTQDGDGTLLDHSMIVYGSGLSDGNAHTHVDLPVLLAGGGSRTLRGGRHIRFEKATPMTNLYLSLLDRMGVKPETLGDSTGRVEHLSEL